VSFARLSADTPPEIERLQIEGWRRMSTEEKAALVTALTNAAFTMTLAGIRDRYPNATPAEHRLHLALITLGPELARKAYPEVEALERP
jgi:hypothetical protein